MFPAPRRQMLIPNPEWFTVDKKKYLPRIDLVAGKTATVKR